MIDLYSSKYSFPLPPYVFCHNIFFDKNIDLGEDVFDDYWMYYLTTDMAMRAELPNPYYKNIAEYKRFKHID